MGSHTKEQIERSNVKYKKQKKATLPRRDQVMLTRLRIGHIKTTHQYLLQKAIRSMCSKCNLK